MAYCGNETLEEFPAPFDTTVAGSEESLLMATKTVTIPLTEPPIQIDKAGPSRAEVLTIDMPLPPANEAGPSGIVASLVSMTVSESLQNPSSELQEVASSFGASLEPPIINPANTSMLIVLPVLLGGLLSLRTKAADIDIFLELAVGPHATTVEIFLKQFFTLLNEALSSLFHDSPAFEVVIAMLEGQVGSIRCIDATLGDSLKLAVDRLQL